MSSSLQPHALKPARLLCPWDSPGKNTGVGCHIFSTQGSNPQSPALAGGVSTTQPPGKPGSQCVFAKWMDERVNRWTRNQRMATRHHGWVTLCTTNAKNEKLDNQLVFLHDRNMLAFTPSEYQVISGYVDTQLEVKDIQHFCCCSVTKTCPILLRPPCTVVPQAPLSQARILEWVAISFSKGSSQSRDWTHVSCICRQILYQWETRELIKHLRLLHKT